MDYPPIAYWLALLRAPGVGPVNFIRLLEHFDNPFQVFDAEVSAWQALKLKGTLLHYLQNPDWEGVENDLLWAEQPNNHLITLNDPAYPARLREIHDPPPVLFVHGNTGLLASAQLAIVGTRNPTRHGEENALEFAEHLSHAGLTITSGLAFGIDAASHQGSLAANGHTIAITGTGLDRVYPPQHRELAHQIAERGALVSEFTPGTPSKAINFPRRNRIISGISLGTLVVEAATDSGSLITARQAVEQGRDVFAIPGSIHNPLARGCHALIKEGAKLVETADDILDELAIPLANINRPAQLPLVNNDALADLDADYTRLLDCLGNVPTTIDDLVELSGLTAEAVSSMLLILELRGLVAAQAGGLYAQLR